MEYIVGRGDDYCVQDNKNNIKVVISKRAFIISIDYD